MDAFMAILSAAPATAPAAVAHDDSFFAGWSFGTASRAVRALPRPVVPIARASRPAAPRPRPRPQPQVIRDDERSRESFDGGVPTVPIRLQSYCEDAVDAEFVANDDEIELDDSDAGAIDFRNVLPEGASRRRWRPTLFGKMVAPPSDDEELESDASDDDEGDDWDADVKEDEVDNGAADSDMEGFAGAAMAAAAVLDSGAWGAPNPALPPRHPHEPTFAIADPNLLDARAYHNEEVLEAQDEDFVLPPSDEEEEDEGDHTADDELYDEDEEEEEEDEAEPEEAEEGDEGDEGDEAEEGDEDEQE